MKKEHSLGFQALNQARSATHAKANLEGSLASVVSDPVTATAFSKYSEFFSIAQKSMREMAIVNVASVLEKQKTSTGMRSLILKVQEKNPELNDLCEEAIVQLKQHESTFAKAVIIRSNIIAHRSRQMTYREVHESTRFRGQRVSTV